MTRYEETSDGKEAQVLELRNFTEQFVDGSRRGIMVSIRDSELSISLLGVTSLECYAMLREAMRLTVERIEEVLGEIDGNQGMH
jgi:hypothetical protein